jgi:hypothetical protein
MPGEKGEHEQEEEGGTGSQSIPEQEMRTNNKHAHL